MCLPGCGAPRPEAVDVVCCCRRQTGNEGRPARQDACNLTLCGMVKAVSEYGSRKPRSLPEAEDEAIVVTGYAADGS